MSVDYREKYKFLKRKLKILVYEHEGLNQELEKSQRKLLKVARDNSFLLDRLLQYEQVTVGESPVDSDMTLSSDSESEGPPPQKKRSTQSNAAKSVKNETTEKVLLPMTSYQPDNDSSHIQNGTLIASPDINIKEECISDVIHPVVSNPQSAVEGNATKPQTTGS